MSKHSLRFAIFASLGWTLFQATTAQGSTLGCPGTPECPTFTVTSATGNASWGVLDGLVTASLSGPDFTLSFTDEWPSSFFILMGTTQFGGQDILPLSEQTGAAVVPSGTLTVSGTTYERSVLRRTGNS